MNNKYLLYLSGVISENQLLSDQTFPDMSNDEKKVEQIFNFVNKMIVGIEDVRIKKNLKDILNVLNGILRS